MPKVCINWMGGADRSNQPISQRFSNPEGPVSATKALAVTTTGITKGTVSRSRATDRRREP